MMNRVGAYAYFEDDDAQAVKIPYRRGAYSMTIVLPRERDGIGELERRLAQARWPDSFAGEMERRMVNLSVPRFRVESTFSLNRAVESIGAASAFNRETADFSGMNGRGDLYISEAVHKAFIDVNEDGTEAAASTALAVSRTSAALDESPPVVFRADHPFIFVIRDEMSGAVLFMGKVARPGRD
jgi:serpin B